MVSAVCCGQSHAMDCGNETRRSRHLLSTHGLKLPTKPELPQSGPPDLKVALHLQEAVCLRGRCTTEAATSHPVLKHLPPLFEPNCGILHLRLS